MTADSTHVLTELWLRQSRWSAAANRAKAQVNRYRIISLTLVVIAATLGAAAPAIDRFSEVGGRISGFVAGTALGLLPLVRARLGIGIYQTWSRLRSVSEALKAEVYTFLAGVDPYRGPDRVLVLHTRSWDVLAKGDDLLRYLREIRAVARPLPEVTDLASYLRLRVGAQSDGYYRKNATILARKASRVRNVNTYLAILAAVLGVAASFGRVELAPWIGVVGTLTGAVIAHSAAARYSFLQLEYLRTAEHLDRIVQIYGHGAASPDRDDSLVAECERVISFQNEAWMAELVTTPVEEPEAAIPPPV
jgi:hypothetical protein